MKKILIYVLAVIAILLTSCEKKKVQSYALQESVVLSKTSVERTIANDRQFMYKNYGNDYVWYETCVKLITFIDQECDGAIESVGNVFQYSKGANTFVVLSTYIDDKHTIEVQKGFWVEDFNMNNDPIRITYKQAFSNMMAANYPKPHSRNCILRKPVGPKACNPQWVFGNIEQQLWVDAVTGEVRNSNPAFDIDDNE